MSDPKRTIVIEAADGSACVVEFEGEKRVAVVLYPVNFRSIQLFLPVSEARDLARVLEAAADQAQKEDTNE